MGNIFLTISYDGTNYAGWQKQKKANTIQENIENAIYEITNERVNLIASGRTDSGVHAISQVANFTTSSTIRPENFYKAINTKLPNDIIVTSSKLVDDDFNSRFSAKKKTYMYQIYNNDIKNPFYDKYSMFVNQKLDIVAMKENINKIVGTYDFTSFYTKEKENPKNPIRTIYSANIEEEGKLIRITITGNGFLYNMVRIITGTLIDIGFNRKEDILKILYEKDRQKAGATAKAKGLFLKSVEY
jgi:tRNA pseudouridine synthase A